MTSNNLKSMAREIQDRGMTQYGYIDTNSEKVGYRLC